MCFLSFPNTLGPVAPAQVYNNGTDSVNVDSNGSDLSH